jgi:hypothetical protein
MSYEQNCRDYALYGNPERDHWDYEENAQYDRYDGYREDFYDEFEDFVEPYSDHVQAFHSYQHIQAEKLRRHLLDLDCQDDEVPF